MGMFDWVAVITDCPGCGERLEGFQSKDRECVLASIGPQAVANFYTSCDKCKAWVEFTRPLAEPEPATSRYYSRTELEAMGFRCVSPEPR